MPIKWGKESTFSEANYPGCVVENVHRFNPSLWEAETVVVNWDLKPSLRKAWNVVNLGSWG